MVPTRKISTSRFLPELPTFNRCVPITVLGPALSYRTLLIFMQFLGKFLKAFRFFNLQDEIFLKTPKFANWVSCFPALARKLEDYHLRRYGFLNFFLKKKKSHGIIWVGMNLKDHLVQSPPPPWAGIPSSGPGCSKCGPTWS